MARIPLNFLHDKGSGTDFRFTLNQKLPAVKQRLLKARLDIGVVDRPGRNMEPVVSRMFRVVLNIIVFYDALLLYAKMCQSVKISKAK